MNDAFQHCMGLLRDRDRDVYLCDLFAPSALRPSLFALHAFDTEIARIRGLVSEPMLGEFRIQWWRDTLAGETAGEAEGHPVASAVLATVRERLLPAAAFSTYLDARMFDLYDDPMPDMVSLEGYAGETACALLQLTALVLDPANAPDASEAAGHGGVAIVLTRLLRELSLAPARHQAFLPADLLQTHGVNRGALMKAGTTPSGLVEALTELRSVARRHLAIAETAASALPPSLRVAFLPLALVGPALDRLDRNAAAPLTAARQHSQIFRQWLIWRASRRG